MDKWIGRLIDNQKVEKKSFVELLGFNDYLSTYHLYHLHLYQYRLLIHVIDTAEFEISREKDEIISRETE